MLAYILKTAAYSHFLILVEVWHKLVSNSLQKQTSNGCAKKLLTASEQVATS